MRILINKHNNDKFKFKQLFLLQSGIIPLSFLPTSGLFCKDATHISIELIKSFGEKIKTQRRSINYNNDYGWILKFNALITVAAR